ncbi:MAG: hypothetical protein JSV89_08125 [Spirochaetaceae bacterium]|nr:MAG: hypothetical protein JSV89_08125 [Spirochaetaceae bacterium]
MGNNGNGDTPGSQIDFQSGLVGFFDILGYQQMLLNNDVEKAARLIVEVIANIPSEVIDSIGKEQGLVCEDDVKTVNYLNQLWKKILSEELNWLLFSDTILVSLPLNRNDKRLFHATRVLAFLQACAFLQRQMFDRGLPLRGAISFGDFFITGTYFAGSPIIESYLASQSLELSGCVLTKTSETVHSELKDYAVKNEFQSILLELDQMCIPYLVPKKSGELEKHLMINWVNLPMHFFAGMPSDIREYVFSTFVQYNKDVTPSVYPKINNTETFIRKILQNVKSTPWPIVTTKIDAYVQKVLSETQIEF